MGNQVNASVVLKKGILGRFTFKHTWLLGRGVAGSKKGVKGEPENSWLAGNWNWVQGLRLGEALP